MSSPAVLVYSRSWCPYCRRALALLASKGVAPEVVDLDRHPEREAEMVAASGGRRTVPQIFVGGEYLGDSDELVRLDRRGELDARLGRAPERG